MSNPKQSKSERKNEAREKARLMREEAERRQRRTRVLLSVAAVVGVLAVVLVIGLVVRSAGDDDVSITAAAPDNVGANGQIVVGEEDAPVTVDLYLDYQCPACKAFEDANVEMLSSMQEEGAIKIAYHPVSILDRFSSGTRYSTRAASAAMCVADQAPAAFEMFNRQMFVNQPPEGESGLTDAEITTIATLAGAPESIASCIEDETYVDYVEQVTDWAGSEENNGGMPGTPWVVVDGEPFDDVPSSAELESAIAAALQEAGGMRPSSTDTPSPSTPTDS